MLRLFYVGIRSIGQPIANFRKRRGEMPNFCVNALIKLISVW